MPWNLAPWELLAAVAALSLLAWTIAVACAHALLSRPVPEGGPTPPLSVLRPLKGLDDGLEENLASLCRQRYPEYELLLGAEDPLDPALEVALRVKRRFPEVPISVVACGGFRGKNPKVRVLRALEARARHGHLLVSDSNVRVRETYLAETAAELRDPRVKLVTNPIAGIAPGGESAGALLENLHLGTFVAAATALVQVLGRRAAVVGKSMLLERAALSRVGGFASVANVLAEDYLLGRKLERAGFRVAVSPHVVSTVNESWPLERFVQRHLRWGQMRRRIAPAAFAGELILNPIAWTALALQACGRDLGVAQALGAAGLVALKLLLDARLLGRLRGAPLPLADLVWIPLKDLTVAAVGPVAFFRRTVRWRGSELRIGRLSRLFPARRTLPAAASEPA